MSMQHKAFLLDYRAFKREIAPLIEAALRSGDLQGLKAFLNANRESLRDPYEGEPLGPNWNEAFDVLWDAHQLGDFALTQYYDPRKDFGLGAAWLEVQAELEASGLPAALALGETLGPSENLFDPGRMGSYFQSEHAVRVGLAQFQGVAASSPLGALAEVLGSAERAGRGLYITF